MTTSEKTVRLHITPFNETIYEKNIPLAIRNGKPKVSFHAVQTFPERGFGYLELPKSDAETIKKKLNGSLLKGVKIRIEEAKPMKRKSDAVFDETSTEPERKRSKKVKVEKRAREVVLTGYELPADRAVKRGWTDEKSAHKKVKKAGDKVPKVEREKSKTLVKTIAPANVKPIQKEKTKKRKEKGDKSRTRKNEVVVKEFAHSRSTFAVSKASSAASKQAVEYRDGEGWVDEDGEVVEAETAQSKRRRGQSVPTQRMSKPSLVAASGVEDRSSLSRDDSTAEDSDEQDSAADAPQLHKTDSETKEDSHESSSEDGSDEDLESSDDSDDKDEIEDAMETTTPEATTTKDIHPLEALYKRPKPGPIDLAPINTSFSFFGASDDQDDATEDAAVMPPQTPHTKQDLDWRGQRSAAPTPDTAAIDGRFDFPFSPSDEDEDEVPSPSHATKPVDSAVDTGEQESDFRKFFYEHRGDSNRAWKERRREAKRLERQRENRRLSRRIV